MAACGGSGGSSAGGGGNGESTGGTTSSGGATTSGGAGAGGTGSGAGGGGVGGCRTAADCDNGDFCADYTMPPLCGGMDDTNFDNLCDVDADCANAGANQICVDTLCVFPHGGAITPKHCRAGCATDADCDGDAGTNLKCTAEHHCEPASCIASAECSENFMCEGGQCVPKTCASDADCGGYCVNGSCYPAIGRCQPAVP